MTTPKMIIFDYGQTLIYEHSVDFLRGHIALSQHIKRNRDNLTPEQINNFSDKLYNQLLGKVSSGEFELHQSQAQRFLYEYLGIEYDLSPEEVETMLWDVSAPGAIMPHVDEVLEHINAKGIRSGVISNISWSGRALTERINRLLPRNKFEFIIASSEYMFRKPSPYLFELALRKAGLPASEVWYCGDNAKADIEGAAAVGIFPVWYEEATIVDPWRRNAGGSVPQVEHLRIQSWLELIETI